MDERSKFWQEHFTHAALTERHEHEMNIYTEHGWLCRVEVYREIFSRLSKNGELKSGSKTLDLACGTGVYARNMLEQKWNVIGYDLNQSLLRMAAAKNRKITWINGDCLDLPFKDDAFDLVVAEGLISILTHPEKFYREIRRIGNSNTHILLGTLHKHYLPYVINPGGYLSPEVSVIHHSGRELMKTLREYFPNGEMLLVPVFIFPRPWRWLEKIFQRYRFWHPITKFFASGLVLLLRRGD